MKKFILMAVFAFTIVTTQFLAVSDVEASDRYVGTSDTTGFQCYLVEDSVDYDHDNVSFTCTLKMVSPKTGNVQFLYYDFWHVKKEGWYFKNSQGYSNKVSGHTPIEGVILESIDSIVGSR